MEAIWDGKVAQTWGNIVPEADFEGTSGEKSACAAIPVIRIVRLDGSGTTYNFKAYLGLLSGAPAGLWTTAPVAGDNNTWPIEGTNTVPKEVNGSGECVEASHICTAKATGGGGVATAVEKTSGSIGYLDLATARQKGFDMVKKANDHLYWIPMQAIEPGKGNAVSGNYVEPTEVATSHVNGGTGPGAALGANCLNADYRGVPAEPASDPTLGDWSNAIATGSKNGDAVTYPICALTYDFAFDDDAPVYGNTQPEQERARTVKDYLSAITSSFGQDNLETNDYGTLPLSVQTIAQKGVAAIDWNKAAGSGGSKEEVKKTPPAEEKPIITPIVTPPSNAFSIAGAKVKGKTIVLSLVLPGAGKVQIKATGGGVTVANVTASVSGGKGSVTLSLSKAALSKLAKIKGHKFSVKITIAFTPTGGSKASKTKTLTLTQAAVTPKKKGSKK
jgi:ABC-type phosphate transport system substrate-binding protein